MKAGIRMQRHSAFHCSSFVVTVREVSNHETKCADHACVVQHMFPVS